MDKCSSISDIFLKCQLDHPGKYAENQLVWKQNLLIMDEWMSVKIFTDVIARVLVGDRGGDSKVSRIERDSKENDKINKAHGS